MWPVKKQYFMYVAVPEIELSLSDSATVSLSHSSNSLTQSDRGTSNAINFTLQCVKDSCQSLVR